MANRWCDGFRRYGGTLAYMLNGSSGQAWAQVDSAFSLSTANPRTGTHCLRVVDSAGSAFARRVFGAPLTEAFVGFAVYCHDLPSAETNGTGFDGVVLASWRDQSNGIQCILFLGSDGALEFRRGQSTVLDRSIPIIGAGAYQHIEMYAKAGNGTDGAFELRVDQVTRLNLTGIDTVSTANIEFSQIAVGHQAQGLVSPTFPTVDFADFFCNDTISDGSACNTFVGDCKSGIRLANADTAQADFALSAGTQGYPLLGEAPPDDATYIDTPATTAESDFGIEAGPANLSEILTVRPFVRAWKDDAGTCTIAPNMKSGAIKGTVSDQPITTAPAYYDSNVPLDPATGVPWVAAGLDSALEVIERIS